MIKIFWKRHRTLGDCIFTSFLSGSCMHPLHLKSITCESFYIKKKPLFLLVIDLTTNIYYHPCILLPDLHYLFVILLRKETNPSGISDFHAFNAWPFQHSPKCL